MQIRICLISLLVLGLSSMAMGQQARPVTSAQATQGVTNDSTQLIEQGTYVNRDGVVVHDPAHTVSGTVPSGASAQCRDGTYSFSQHHRGTCSHHGGVSRWLK